MSRPAELGNGVIHASNGTIYVLDRFDPQFVRQATALTNRPASVDP